VAYAIKIESLKKEPCEVCGCEKVHAHHDDYDKPLNVRWLCTIHHNEWHSKNGEGKNAR
jgi:ribosomal protein S27AE